MASPRRVTIPPPLTLPGAAGRRLTSIMRFAALLILTLLSCAKLITSSPATLRLTPRQLEAGTTFDTDSPLSSGWHALASKLSRGEPVVVTAVGSSVAGVWGGCSDMADAVREHCDALAREGRGENATAGVDGAPICCGAGTFTEWTLNGGGWLKLVVEWLETRYPPRGDGRHSLVNLGRPGGGVMVQKL